MGSLATLSGISGKPAGPLSVSYPSPMLLIHYPLIAANVRILCDKDASRSRGQSSLTTTFYALRSTYREEGVIGVYRGAHLHLLHQAARDTLRLLAERGIRFVERRLEDRGRRQGGGAGATRDSGGSAVVLAGGEGQEVEVVRQRRAYRRRVAAKYLIDVVCYPLLLASTRMVILHGDPRNTWQQMCYWRQEEGALSLFSGLTASLLSTALDEVMDMVLAYCIEYCATGTDMELPDRLLLKASGSSVVSIFTAPVNYIGIIQRCQSRIPGLTPPEPLPELVWSLPWRGSLTQFLLFGGLMAVNVRLIQWKIQLQNEQDGA